MKVYFFCRTPGPPEDAGYEHELVSLSEGFESMGIVSHGNLNYWKVSASAEQWQIVHDREVSYRDCDIVFFSNRCYGFQNQALLPKDLFDSGRSYKLVFVDAADGFQTPGLNSVMRKCDLVLKCHYNRKESYPKNYRPWAFGLTNRILKETERSSPDPRLPEVLVNYRVGHSLRDMADRLILAKLPSFLSINRNSDSFEMQPSSPDDLLMWGQTGRRHYPDYYRRLCKSIASSCFGGSPDKMDANRVGVLWKTVSRVNRRLDLLKIVRVNQFDSWRLWESFAAGAVVLHVDFAKYGCLFPVMPTNGLEYLGFNLYRPEGLLKVIEREPERLALIGRAGQIWARKHYSPSTVAQRALGLIFDSGN